MYLTSYLWSGNVVNQSDNLGASVFRIPKGCNFKIWENTIYGAPATVMVQASSDGYGSSWIPGKSDTNSTVNNERAFRHSSRPIVIQSPDGNKAVRFLYNVNGTADTISGNNNNVYADYTVEVVESNLF